MKNDQLVYQIKVIPQERWMGDYGWEYSSPESSRYTLTASSIEELYNVIAKDYNEYIVKIEDKCSDDRYEDIENYSISYSDIFIVVEKYSEEKRNATAAYKEIGAVRDSFLKKKKEEEERERIRLEKYYELQREEKDKREFERLKEKFGK